MKQQEQSCDRLKTKSTPSPLVLGLDWSLTILITKLCKDGLIKHDKLMTVVFILLQIIKIIYNILADIADIAPVDNVKNKKSDRKYNSANAVYVPWLKPTDFLCSTFCHIWQ